MNNRAKIKEMVTERVQAAFDQAATQRANPTLRETSEERELREKAERKAEVLRRIEANADEIDRVIAEAMAGKKDRLCLFWVSGCFWSEHGKSSRGVSKKSAKTRLHSIMEALGLAKPRKWAHGIMLIDDDDVATFIEWVKNTYWGAVWCEHYKDSSFSRPQALGCSGRTHVCQQLFLDWIK